MSARYTTAITIRSFDLHGLAYAKLSRTTDIRFVNTSGKRLPAVDLCRAIREADGIIAGTESYTADVLQSAPGLKVISRVGVGTDNIDLDFAKEAGIRVMNTPLAPVDAVAEHTIGLLFSLTKNIPRYYENVHKGDFSICPGSLITGKTVGIIGLGRIGRKVATLLEALGTRITFYDPWIQDPFPDRWSRKDTLPDLLHEADIVSLHTSPQVGGALLDEKAFTLCKRGVIIINTSRGSLIDEQGLAHALNNGIVSAAGLDVVSVEPYNGPLTNYPGVVITPHVASNTFESRQQMEIEAVENILHIFGV